MSLLAQQLRSSTGSRVVFGPERNHVEGRRAENDSRPLWDTARVSNRWRSGAIWACLRFVLVLQILWAIPPIGSGALGAEYEVDFSNSRFDNARLRLMGPGAPTLVRPSPDGLVISMPRGSNADEVGFAPRFSLRGDFEITLQYELLQIAQPKEGYGVGPTVYIITVSEEEDAATVGRMHRVEEGQVHSTHLARTPGGEGRRHHDVRFFENDTRRGLLRLTRVGDQLRFAASAGGEADFRTLRELRFSTGDVRLVRVALMRNGAGPEIPAEVRLKHFSIRADQFPDYSDSRWRLWLGLAVLFGLVGIGIGGVVWRRKRG